MMNGELYFLCAVTAASRKALRNRTRMKCVRAQNINTVTFSFLPEKKRFRTKQYTASDVSSWSEQLQKKGVREIQLFCPLAVQNRPLLGLSNTQESALLCFFKNGTAAFFLPHWRPDTESDLWNIDLSEQVWADPPSDIPAFANNSDEFRKALSDIQGFARKLGCDDFFARTFSSALHILDGHDEALIPEFEQSLSELPPEHFRLFRAAYVADVFGAMGSWNDSPAYMAEAKGMKQEYDKLSDALLKNLRLALLYAINEG